MQNIFEKKNSFTFVLPLLELGGINVFFFFTVGRRTPHTVFKSLLKYMYLEWEKILNYFGHPSRNRLALKNRLPWRMNSPVRFVDTGLLGREVRHRAVGMCGVAISTAFLSVSMRNLPQNGMRSTPLLPSFNYVPGSQSGVGLKKNSDT